MPPVVKKYGGVKKRNPLKYLVQADAESFDVFDALKLQNIKTSRALIKNESKQKKRAHKSKKEIYIPAPELGQDSPDSLFDRLLLEGPVARELPDKHVGDSSSSFCSSSSNSSPEVSAMADLRIKTFFPKTRRKKEIKRVGERKYSVKETKDSAGNGVIIKSCAPVSQNLQQDESKENDVPFNSFQHEVGRPQSSSTPVCKLKSDVGLFISPVFSCTEGESCQQPLRPSSSGSPATSFSKSADQRSLDGTFLQHLPSSIELCGVCGGQQEACQCKELGLSAAYRLKQRRFKKNLHPSLQFNCSLKVDNLRKSLLSQVKASSSFCAERTNCMSEQVSRSDVERSGCDLHDVPFNTSHKQISLSEMHKSGLLRTYSSKNTSTGCHSRDESSINPSVLANYSRSEKAKDSDHDIFADESSINPSVLGNYSRNEKAEDSDHDNFVETSLCNTSNPIQVSVLNVQKSRVSDHEHSGAMSSMVDTVADFDKEVCAKVAEISLGVHCFGRSYEAGSACISPPISANKADKSVNSFCDLTSNPQAYPASAVIESSVVERLSDEPSAGKQVTNADEQIDQDLSAEILPYVTHASTGYYSAGGVNNSCKLLSVPEESFISSPKLSSNSAISKEESLQSARSSMRCSNFAPQQVVLKPGKQYRRSLSILRGRRSSAVEESSVNCSPRCSTGRQPVKGRLWESSLNHIKEIQLDGSIKVNEQWKIVPALFERVQEYELNSSLKNTVDSLGTAKFEVLQCCGQEEPLPFVDCYPASMKASCVKIGEGVYGEVFMFNGCKGRDPAVIKVIPIEGDLEVNGEPQKKFSEILSEIVIAQELSNLHSRTENATEMFNKVQAVRCVFGSYPVWMCELWYEYDANKGSENDAPDSFAEDQLYIVLELSNGGKDLESFVFSSADQGLAAFKQMALTLAVGESALQFEHRDLHWGNVLVSPCNEKQVNFTLHGHTYHFPSKSIRISIIDFTLSRISNPRTGLPMFYDLSRDESLFTAQGDYQFEVYRLMKECTKNEWSTFTPKTNVVWLHYLLDKLCSMARYKNRGSKIHQRALDTMQEMYDTVLQYPSAAEFAKTSYFKK